MVAQTYLMPDLYSAPAVRPKLRLPVRFVRTWA